MRILAWIALGAVLGAGCVAERDGSAPAQDIILPDGGPGPRCGETTCASGQVCCNESCGICTEPGGFCTLQLCGPAAVPHVAGDENGDGTIDANDRPLRTVGRMDAEQWEWTHRIRIDDEPPSD